MAIKNQLANTQQKKPLSVTYKAGNADVTLTLGMIKKYLVTGSPENVTEPELMMFMSLCKYQGLNPFVKDAYLIKYGTQAATIVVGKGALEKRAARCDKYKGFEAGIIVRTESGEIENRTGTFYLPEEQLVGGWAKVYVDGFAQPVEAAVALSEYIGRKKDGTINGQWTSKPATMIRKVAKAQALREAFPEDMAGMYVAEETGMSYDDLPAEPVLMPEEPAAVQAVPVQAAPAPQAVPQQVQPVQPAPMDLPFDDDFASIMEG